MTHTSFSAEYPGGRHIVEGQDDCSRECGPGIVPSSVNVETFAFTGELGFMLPGHGRAPIPTISLMASSANHAATVTSFYDLPVASLTPASGSSALPSPVRPSEP